MDFETPDAEAVKPGDFTTPDEESIDQSPIESAARGALRNIPLAQQAAAAIAPINPLSAKGNYSDELAHLTEAAEQGKAQNPASYYTGAAAGTIAPMLIPGVGEVAEAARGAGAAGGALNAAAQSVSDVNLTKPTARDVGNTALSALLGGALGKVFSGGKPALAGAEGEAAGEAAPAAAEATEKAAIPDAVKDAAQAAVPTPSIPGAQVNGPTAIGGRQIPNKPVAADFTPSPDRVSASLISQGLGGSPRQQMKLWIGKDPIEAFNNIGTWMKTADDGKSIADLMDRPGALLSKVQAIHDKAGATIGDLIDKVAPGAQVDGGEIAFKLDQILDETYDQKAQYAVEKLQNQIQKAEAGGRLDFDALQKIKGSFGKTAASSPHDAAGATIKQTYGVLSQYMNDIVDQYGARIKDPDTLAQYAKAKADYHAASNLLPVLRYQEAKDLMGGPGGHFSLRGLLATMVNGGAAAMGVPTPEAFVKNAMLKAGAALSPEAAPKVAAAVPQAAAAAAPRLGPAFGKNLSRAAQLELENALQSKFGKGK